MSGVLAIGTLQGGGLHQASLEVAQAGHGLANSLKVPLWGGLIGCDCQEATRDFASGGMSNLFVVDDPRLRQYSAEQYVAAALSIVERCAPSIILLAHTLDTGEWGPQLAAELHAATAIDCHAVSVGADDQVTITKSICGGAIQAEYTLRQRALVATLTPGMYAAATRPLCSVITTVALPQIDPQVSVVEELVDQGDSGPALKGARIVVGGGLGVGGRDHWNLVTDTAAALGAAVGATRAVVEAGWVPSSQQVGYSGNRIAPDLYVAIGISGAVHHLVGISQAKSVVAINTDANADIFRVSRFGVVGDAKSVIPAFIERTRALRAHKQ